MEVYLITKNAGKIKAAKDVFDKFGIEVKNIEKEFPEIQANNSKEIAKYTALQAATELKVPVIREDHSLYIHALNMPGPYMAFVEKAIPAAKLLEILNLSSDRTGHFEVSTAYADAEGNVHEFSYDVPVHFKTEETVKDPRNGWNGLICLENETRALTEYPEEERLSSWNKNYFEIAKLLTQGK